MQGFKKQTGQNQIFIGVQTEIYMKSYLLKGLNWIFKDKK